VLEAREPPGRGGALGKGLFFTGTDTGVGKTFVTAWVARHLRGQGRPVRVAKPVATGAARQDDRWVSEDTVRLAEAAGLVAAGDEVTPWVFPEPAAPPVAARLQGVVLRLGQLVEAVTRAARPDVPILVEGVGGLLCPLTDTETVADLAAALGLPLVIVARHGLGTLNHTLLTVEVARLRRLPVAGVVVNQTQPPRGVAEQTNVAELRRRLDVPLLGVSRYQPGPAVEPQPELAGVDWWGLCQL
jgi:dethiobiotin synthetase